MKSSIDIGVGIVLLMAVSTAAPAQTQMELTAKAAADAQKADAELTQVYHELKKSPTLIAAERAWIVYRDAECRYEHHASPGGSMYPMETAMCLTAMTRQRTDILKKNLKEHYDE